MSKPKDPVIAVLQFFENAELILAQQALSMAEAIVKRRAPKKTLAAAVSTRSRRKHQESEPPLPLN